MRANILLIMEDVFAPRPFWVLLPCHERPLQKVRAKSIMRIWKNAVWMWEPAVRRLFVQLLTSEFGSLLRYKARSAHVGGERWRWQMYSSAAAGRVGAGALTTTVVFFDTICSRVSCNGCWKRGKKWGAVALHWRESSFTFVVRISDKNEAGIYEGKRSWFKEWCMRWL